MSDKDSRFLIATLSLISLALAGCSHQPPKEQPAASTAETPPPPEAAPVAAAQPTPAAEPVVRNETMAEVADLAPVRFDFDSDMITPDNGAILRQNAQWLQAHQGVAIQVAGYCDQRGTVEYNLALGQRRAEAVRKYYGMLGIPEARVATISYGKEVPACDQETDECWSQNRIAKSLEATPVSLSSVFSQWPELAQLAARVMLEKYGPPQEVSEMSLSWRAPAPWKRFVVHKDEVAPLEQAVGYAVPSGKVAALLKFGHGLDIRPNEGVLAARGDSEAHILLALNLANDIANGTMTPAQAEGFYAKAVSLEVAGKSSPYTQHLLF